MATGSVSNHPPSPGDARVDLVPREYLKVIAVWSLVPAYAVAGALFGWLADRALETFPFGVGVGLLLGLGLAVRDMLRLRDEL